MPQRPFRFGLDGQRTRLPNQWGRLRLRTYLGSPPQPWVQKVREVLESHVVRVCSLESAACGQVEADAGGAAAIAVADTVALVLRRLRARRHVYIEGTACADPCRHMARRAHHIE